MRPKGTKRELEARRRRAVALLDEGHGVRETARMVGVHAGSVSRWQQMHEAEGFSGLDAKPHPGRQPKIRAIQFQKLKSALLRGARAHGFRSDLWTLERVAKVIDQEFQVSLHPSNVWELLRRMGWSCQKPERRARERDEQAVMTWRQETWPAIKKSPQRRP